MTVKQGSETTQTGKSNTAVWLILALYLLITVAYGLVNPLFEAPDEVWHYFTAQYIAENGRLPIIAATPDPWLSQEAAQPPLYYIISAALIAPIDTTHARQEVWPNPLAYPGDASLQANINQFIHSPREAQPWDGYVLAAHLLRLSSTLLGLGALLCIYGSSRLLWPDDTRKALLAMALVAFLPQFNFLHASVSNDPLIIFLASAAVYQLLWLWQNKPATGRLLLLGITVGLAALSKNAGILLLIYAAIVLILREIKDWRLALSNVEGSEIRDYRPPITAHRSPITANRLPLTIYHLLLFLLPALLIAGWLWARNWQLYGDFTAANQFLRFDQGDGGFTALEVLGQTGGLLRSAVAVFGWFNVLPPAWIYAVWGGLVLLAIAGVIRDWRLEIGNLKQSLIFNLQSPILLLTLWPLLVYAGLFRFMLLTPAAQGRLLFPAILPLALGLSYGLTRWRWQPLPWLASGLALLTTLYSLFFVIRPVYAQPPIVAALPENVAPLNLKMGNGLTLLGVNVETDTAVPRQTIPLTLYWTANPVPEEPPELVLELFGRDLALLGQYHAYHGRGNYPANLWPPGQIVADRVNIRVTDTAVTPALARLFARLNNTGAEAQEIAAVKIIPKSWPKGGEETLATLGDGIELTAVSLDQTTAQPGETITINPTWRVAAPPGQPLTTLVHLAEAGQPPLAAGDSPPLNGSYPTAVWEAGELIEDSYTLSIPDNLADGRYPIWIGMYNPDTLARLPLTINGRRQPNDVYLAGWVEIGD